MKHSSEFESIVDDAKTRIKEIDVEGSLKLMKSGAKLIDVREDREWSDHAADAEHIGRGVLERDIVEKVPDKETSIILYCGGGFRSALSADNLQRMGYTKVYSLAGGWKAWKEAGAPVDVEMPF